MDTYLVFLTVTVLAVLSPGPGVILTLSNAVRFGISGALPGILGIAAGTFVVALLSASSLALLLMASAEAFTLIKYLGAIYLCYLGVKLWRSAPLEPANAGGTKDGLRRFIEGLALQLTNPKAVLFFISVFPQFADFSQPDSGHFVWLVVIYSVTVIIIHLLYAASTRLAQSLLISKRCGRFLSRLGGGCFICFGVGVATSAK